VVFSVEDRDRVRERVLALAARDERIVGAALVGSLASGRGDRWSDLDLTFAVRDGVAVRAVLDDWTQRMRDEVDALPLFDLPSGETIYRVFLLPGGLQCDLSFSPERHFGAAGPRFQLLYGQAADLPPPPGRSAREIFGWGVAYARDARACIDRGRPWQAEHCTSAVRDHALDLACARRGLPARFGRGYDNLPPDVLRSFDGTLVRTLAAEELLRALERSVDCLLAEAAELGDLAARVEPRIRAWFVES
jgi:predicted nucleotidyltransferase